jgi:predicted dienelactone hydrolase
MPASIRARVAAIVAASSLFAAAAPSLAGASSSIVTSERVFVDSSRPTRANGTFPGAPERTLRVRLWHPAACAGDRCAPYPLLLVAHGFGGLPEKFNALAAFIASNGYVVAAPAFPLTNQSAPGGHLSGLTDVVEQPEDLFFVYGELSAASQAPEDDLEGLLDPSQTIALGHSLGGLTVLAWAHSDCCREAPLRGTILVSALSALALFEANPIDTGPPTLLIHGTDDPLVSFSFAEPLLETLPEPRALVGVQGAGHAELLESQSEPPIPAREATQRAIVAFLGALLRHDRGALDAAFEQLAGDGHIVIAPSCAGDCGGDGKVSLGDAVLSVRIGLGGAPLAACPAVDGDGSGAAEVDELVTTVRHLLAGACPL